MARARAVTSSSGVAYGPNVMTGYGPTAANLITVSFLKSICQPKITYMQIVHTSTMSLHLTEYKTDSHSFANTKNVRLSCQKNHLSPQGCISQNSKCFPSWENVENPWVRLIQRNCVLVIAPSICIPGENLHNLPIFFVRYFS